MRNETRIAIRPNESRPVRKITKIVAYRSGGFGVLTPYHQARQGFLAKLPIDYNRVGDFKVAVSEVIGFKAENRVKLSYHPDGFAQFSAETPGTIISGRNPDGTIKGAGLMTSPLSRPISTGPTFGITAWGIEHFDELQDDSDAIIFTKPDFYHRDCSPTEANGYLLEVFVFPERYWAGVRETPTGEYRLQIAFRNFSAPEAVIELKVIPLPNQTVFLGAFVSRLRTSFASESGWNLGGPGTRDKSGRGEVLQAFYPRSLFPVASSRSLDR